MGDIVSKRFAGIGIHDEIEGPGWLSQAQSCRNKGRSSLGDGEFGGTPQAGAVGVDSDAAEEMVCAEGLGHPCRCRRVGAPR